MHGRVTEAGVMIPSWRDLGWFFVLSKGNFVGFPQMTRKVIRIVPKYKSQARLLTFDLENQYVHSNYYRKIDESVYEKGACESLPW